MGTTPPATAKYCNLGGQDPEKLQAKQGKSNLNGQVEPRGVPCLQQQRVDQSEQLHDPFILPRVLVALQQEPVVVAVAT